MFVFIEFVVQNGRVFKNKQNKNFKINTRTKMVEYTTICNWVSLQKNVAVFYYIFYVCTTFEGRIDLYHRYQKTLQIED